MLSASFIPISHRQFNPIQDALETSWPDAIFYFHQEGNEFPGVLDDYEAGKCQVMVIGYEDTKWDSIFLERLCDLDLVYTDSVADEIPIAFPTRQGIASGWSYWQNEGEKIGYSLQTAKDQFPQGSSCVVNLVEERYEGSKYDEIGVKNMVSKVIICPSHPRAPQLHQPN